MGTGAALALNLLFGLLDRASAIQGLFSKAQAEGRDITSAELDALVADDEAARTQLQADIAAARAAGK